MKIAIILLTAIFSSTALANTEIETGYELSLDEVQVEKIEVDGKVSSNMKGLYKEFKFMGQEEKPIFLIAKSK